MDYFGINSTEDLPKIKEVLADQIVEATVIKPEDFTDNNVYEQVSEEANEVRSEEETPNLPEEDATASDVEGDLNEAESDEAASSPESPIE